MYEHEEVEEKEAEKLAKDLGAIFQKTSAKQSKGIENLIIKIGKKILNPNLLASSYEIISVEKINKKNKTTVNEEVKKNNSKNKF